MKKTTLDTIQMKEARKSDYWRLFILSSILGVGFGAGLAVGRFFTLQQVDKMKLRERAECQRRHLISIPDQVWETFEKDGHQLHLMFEK